MPLDQYTHQSIVRAAQEHGIDPAVALAIAERESSFNVHGGSGSPYSSAYGLFQLLRAERAQYGGNSSDPYEQSTAWSNYIQPHKQHMTKIMGREPTGPELYLGHLIGPGRAARIVAGHIHPDTPIQDVMTPRELAANPFMVRAGTAGALSSSVQRDIARRMAKFGGEAPEISGQISGQISQQSAPGKFGQPFNFAAYGEPVDAEPAEAGNSLKPSSSRPGGNSLNLSSSRAAAPASAKPSPYNFSRFGELVEGPETDSAPGGSRQSFSDKTGQDLAWTVGIPMNLDKSKVSENIEDRRDEPPMGGLESFGRQVASQIADKHRANNAAPMPVYSSDPMSAAAGYNDIEP